MDEKTAFLNELKNFLMNEDEVDTLMIKYRFQNSDEMIRVVVNALNGVKEDGLLRISDVRRYLQDLLNYLKDEGFIGIDEDEYYDYEYKIHVLENLVDDLEPYRFEQIARIITSDERVGLEHLSKEKKLPREMKDEIMTYTGIIPKGGRKKSKISKTKKTKKTIKQRKGKTKRRNGKSRRI